MTSRYERGVYSLGKRSGGEFREIRNLRLGGGVKIESAQTVCRQCWVKVFGLRGLVVWRLALKHLVLALSCVAACTGATAQQSGVDAAAMTVLHLSSKLVVLDAIVADKKTGRMETTLMANDFVLQEDGVPQRIRDFSQDKLPLSIVLMFDLTESVRPQLKDLAVGAETVLAHLKPEDEVAVMTFSSAAQLLQPFTTDHKAVGAAIARAAASRTSEGTFLDESVYEGAEEAMRSTIPGSRRVLLFFTDGTENDAHGPMTKVYGRHAPKTLHSGAEAREELRQTGVTVSALIDRSVAEDAELAIEMANPPSYAFGASPRMDHVGRLAMDTGGPVLHGSGKQVAEKMGTLIEEIRGRYTIGYVPTTPQPAGTLCHVSLKLTAAAMAAHPELKQGHYVVETRAAYYR